MESNPAAIDYMTALVLIFVIYMLFISLLFISQVEIISSTQFVCLKALIFSNKDSNANWAYQSWEYDMRCLFSRRVLHRKDANLKFCHNVEGHRWWSRLHLERMTWAFVPWKANALVPAIASPFLTSGPNVFAMCTLREPLLNAASRIVAMYEFAFDSRGSAAIWLHENLNTKTDSQQVVLGPQDKSRCYDEASTDSPWSIVHLNQKLRTNALFKDKDFDFLPKCREKISET